MHACASAPEPPSLFKNAEKGKAEMEKIIVTNHDDGVTLIAINRPERRNAICAQTALELQAAFAEFDRSGTQRIAVLTGTGDEAFSGGADVTNLPELWRCVPTVGISTDKPIIGAVGGWCVGGAMVIAMMCDLMVAADNARFSYPEAKLGFTGGMIAGLAGRIPHKIAMEIMMLGRTVDAARAHEIGLVNQVVPKGQQVEAALAMARELAGMAPLVLQTIKRFVTESVLAQGPSEKMGRAQRELGIVRDSADIEEGMLAFREKRAPRFTGR
ncbi:enoyl-CoA hydratase [Zeimonas arvi]|uniref:Enoyl-CoA hydratase n=2 Tax=Zeimonas arvi TaxID=2498847 RepID=A0A5C8NUP4_9BURK|nr:enoyl-CoA hydratase [Zeimonas arvi]